MMNMFIRNVLFYLIWVLLWVINGQAFSEDYQEDTKLTIADMVDKAVGHYHAEEWIDAVNFFEKALVAYKMMQHVDITCEDRCKNVNVSKELPLDFKDNHDLKYMGKILVKSNCIKLCKEEHPFDSEVQYIPPQLQEDLNTKKAYDFLQFAYYKLNSFKKASQAAFTFYQANSDNDEAYDNIYRYKEMEGISEENFKDLEQAKFYDNFMKGVKAYQAHNYGEVITSLEESLVEYYKSHEECRSLCYKPSYPTYFYRFYKAMTEHYIGSLECELECKEKLDPVVKGNRLENFAAECYSYLQFSYFTLQNYELAVSAAVSTLLLNPEHENAEQNINYYRTEAAELNISEEHFHPRADAEKFNSYLDELKELIGIGREVLNKDDEGEVIEEDEIDIANLIATLSNSIAEKLDDKLQHI